MTLRISQYAVVCGLGLFTLPGVVAAQAPRYQSPINAPVQQISLPVTPAITPNAEVVEDAVVRVNDQIINSSDVERARDQLAQELQQSHASPADSAEREKNMLRDLIDQQLLLSRGKELGLNADAEVIRRLDEIRKQNKMDSMEELEKAARQQGVSFEDFKANIRNQIITQQVVRDEVGRKLQMTAGQEQAYYDAHKQEFAQPEQVRLSEILIPTAADANDAAIAQAQTKAAEVETKLKAGSPFEDLAKTYSGGPTAAQGGDLGQPYKRGALAKVLEDQTFDLKVGQFTAPIRTRQGFVILKVTAHDAAGVPPLKEIEPQIQEAIYTEQMQPALRAYLTKLREDAYISIKAGYVDSGASPTQAKSDFLFTAYTAPVPKKKTVVQKQRFDRGGRFSEVTKGGSATAPAAGTAVAATTTTTTGGQLAPLTKRRKIRREKVRFGQAPRQSLPNGPENVGMASDDGLGANHEGVEKGAPAGPSSLGTTIGPQTPAEDASTSASEVNPLAPQAAPQKKTRYSDRAREVSAEKKQKKVAKIKEKQISAAPPMTAEEKAAAATQAAPLGLNGDTAKKPKKVKVKGAPKERLQNQAPKPPAPALVETPSKASDRGTPYEGTAGPARTQPSSDQTTLPPVTPPSSTNPPTGSTTPATPGAPIPAPPPQ
ncbi:MAG: peptidyl-prolyl cis-trans isomerase [Granulicella sp.]